MPSRRWMNDQYLDCKTYGHAFRFTGETEGLRDNRRHPNWGRFVRMWLHCDDCTSDAYDDVAPLNNPMGLEAGTRLRSRRILYVKGYRDNYGEDQKPTRNQMRMFIIKRKN